jgi:hypothetical protein
MMDSILAPLALPVFSRHIAPESMFDLLFGRKHVCMALSLENFIKKCMKEGLNVRHGTNQETSRLEQAGVKPYCYKGKSIFIGNGTNEMALMDGIFIRAFFHGQKPVSTIKTLLSANGPT